MKTSLQLRQAQCQEPPIHVADAWSFDNINQPSPFIRDPIDAWPVVDDAFGPRVRKKSPRVILLRDIRLEAQRAMPWVMAFLLIVWSLGDPSTRAEIHASALSFDQNMAALAPADMLESIP